MRWPSLTPAGMRTVIVRVWVVMPLPAQVGHGSSITEPVPRQLRQGSENANAPWLRLPARGALHPRAGVGRGARLRAGAVAGRAGARALHAQGHGHPEDGLLEGERRLRLDVLSPYGAGRRLAAGAGTGATRAAPTEQTAEQVAEATGPAAPRLPQEVPEVE